MNRDSRRARLVLVLLLLTSITLIAVDYRTGGGPPLSALRNVSSSVLGPVERAAGAIADPVRRAVTGLGGLSSRQSELDRLRRENADLRQQVRLGDLDRSRADQLDRLLALAGRGQYRVLPARVIALGGTVGFEWTATIDAGARDGLRSGMTVVNGDGLVGRLTTVGTSTSTVLLAIDRTFSAGARLESSLKVGTVTGDGLRPLGFTLLDQNERIGVGQRLVTLGADTGSSFAPEVPIGVVTAVRNTPGAFTRSATVRPYVDFTSLYLVGVVVQAPRQVPRNAVLPPRPTPSAAPPPAAPAPSPTPSPTASG